MSESSGRYSVGLAVDVPGTGSAQEAAAGWADEPGTESEVQLLSPTACHTSHSLRSILS